MPWRGATTASRRSRGSPARGWTAVNMTALDPGPRSPPAADPAQPRGRRDRAHRRRRLPERLERLGMERLVGTAPGGMMRSPRRRRRCAPSTRSTSSCARTPARSAGSPGRGGLVGLEDSPRRRRLGPAVVARDVAADVAVRRGGGDVVYNVYDAGRGPQERVRRLTSTAAGTPPAARVRPRRRRLTAHARLVSFGKRPRLGQRAPDRRRAARVRHGHGLAARRLDAPPPRTPPGFYVLRLRRADPPDRLKRSARGQLGLRARRDRAHPRQSR